MPSSRSVSTTPTWKMQREEPPEKRKPIRRAPRRRESTRGLSSPKRVGGKSGKKDGVADGAVLRRLHDRRHHYRPTRQREHRRRHRVSGRAELAGAVAAADDEHRRAGEAEEDEVDGDDV